MDRRVAIKVISLRRKMLVHSTSLSAVAASYNGRGRNETSSMMISTTIQEENEEDLVDRPSGETSSTPILHAGRGSETKTNIRTSPTADQIRRVSHLAMNAVSSVATATSKFFSRVLRTRAHSRQGLRTPANKTLISVFPAFATTTSKFSKRLFGVAPVERSSTVQRSVAADGQISSGDENYCKQYQHHHNFRHLHHRNHNHNHLHHHVHLHHQYKQSHSQVQQHHHHGSGHLVPQMDGDDVRLALQALQLAARIHDHVWAPGRPAACSRGALLEAASPLYDAAIAATRAIKHRALHSLVKQAVKRYVNPQRGSPDDVLRVILELLTGCGSAVLPVAAVATAQPSPSGRIEVRVTCSGVAGSSDGSGSSGAGAVDKVCRKLSPVVAAGTAGNEKASSQWPSTHQRVSRETSSSSPLERSGDSCGSGCSGTGFTAGGDICASSWSSSSLTTPFDSFKSSSGSTNTLTRSGGSNISSGSGVHNNRLLSLCKRD